MQEPKCTLSQNGYGKIDCEPRASPSAPSPAARPPPPPNSRHVKSHGIIGLGKDGGTELHGWLLDGSWGKLPGLLGGFAGAPGWQLEVVSGRAAGGGLACGHRCRAHPDLSQGPADLQSAALATELCTHDRWLRR